MSAAPAIPKHLYTHTDGTQVEILSLLRSGERAVSVEFIRPDNKLTFRLPRAQFIACFTPVDALRNADLFDQLDTISGARDLVDQPEPATAATPPRRRAA